MGLLGFDCFGLFSMYVYIYICVCLFNSNVGLTTFAGVLFRFDFLHHCSPKS